MGVEITPRGGVAGGVRGLGTCVNLQISGVASKLSQNSVSPARFRPVAYEVKKSARRRQPQEEERAPRSMQNSDFY